jgi:hypothetical protein
MAVCSVLCCKGAKATDLEGAESVQSSLEIVQDNRVGQTLEDEGELPKWIDANGETG